LFLHISLLPSEVFQPQPVSGCCEENLEGTCQCRNFVEKMFSLLKKSPRFKGANSWEYRFVPILQLLLFEWPHPESQRRAHHARSFPN
jgi:hypothetical protein